MIPFLSNYTPSGVQIFNESGSFQVPQNTFSVAVLVVAGGGGGGGGGGFGGAGGGAGGVSYNATYSTTPGSYISVTVGAGGAGAASGSAVVGSNGGNSAFGSITTTGGGGGGVGNSGGSAGGSGGGSANTGVAAGAGTSGQGYAGGQGVGFGYGGGGGAGAVGGTGEAGGAQVGGVGGAGYTSSISGSSTTYAGGGGGWGYATAGTGGSGGGGASGTNSVANGTNGTANTGGGGGGSGTGGSGGNGGSGVVIVKWGPTVLTALATSLVSYWKLNESAGNASDSVGGNSLTNNGTAPYVSGKISNAIDLERGSSQYLSITDAAQTGLEISGNMSVSLWYKPESQVTDAHILVSKFNYATGDQRSYQFYYEDETGSGAYRLSMAISSDGITAVVVRKSQTLTLGTFYHIVFVYTASTGTGEIYLNGTSLGTGTGLPTSIFDGTADFRIGANHTGLYADGIIDEVGVWTRALSASDVTSLYSSGSGQSYPF